MKSKTKVLYGLFCIVMAGLLWNCSPENDYVKEQNREISLNEATFDEVLKDKLFNSAYSRFVKSASPLTNPADARTPLEEQYGFSIIEGIPAKVIRKERPTISL